MRHRIRVGPWLSKEIISRRRYRGFLTPFWWTPGSYDEMMMMMLLCFLVVQGLVFGEKEYNIYIYFFSSKYWENDAFDGDLGTCWQI